MKNKLISMIDQLEDFSGRSGVGLQAGAERGIQPREIQGSGEEAVQC